MEKIYEVYVNNSDNRYIVDKEGYALFKKYTWYSTSGDYKYLRAKVSNNGVYSILKFHIEIMKDDILRYVIKYPNVKFIIDHINGDIFDNRKSNLRVRTQSENNMNKKIQTNNTTGVVGVSWHTKSRMWIAFISVKNKRINLGQFYYFRNAVKSRINAERMHFGEHAYYLRDEDYKSLIDSIVNMDEIDEPIFTTRKGKYEVNGISKRKDKYRVRFFFNGNETSQTCDSLEEAVKWRKQKEIDNYGSLLTFNDEKVDKQI